MKVNKKWEGFFKYISDGRNEEQKKKKARLHQLLEKYENRDYSLAYTFIMYKFAEPRDRLKLTEEY